MRKKVFFFIAVLLFCLTAYALFLYNKPHANVAAIAPAFTVKATDLYTAYEQNEQNANTKFLDKIIAVQGVVNDIFKTDSTLTILLQSGNIAGGVSCNIASAKENYLSIKKGEPINIKGRCTGFLADVTLADCVVEK